MRGVRRYVAAVLATALVAAGCSGGGGAGRKNEAHAPKAVGQGEGALSLVTWNGYTESGGNDPRVDWVTPFEKKTKCKVTIKYAANAQEMLDLMSRPNLHYDGVSAPPEIAGQLVAQRQVAAINTKLVEGYGDIESRLRKQLTKKHTTYGVPFVWGANLLMYDPKALRSAPDSWGALFDPAKAKAYSGRLIVRDSYLTLGDAALYLKAHRKKLKIKDPFELTDAQLKAAQQVIARQRPMVKRYWLNPSDAVSAFADGGAVLGQVWPYQVDVLGRGGRQVVGVTPHEGMTGWLDSWMIGARADHPSCMYQWLNWTASPDVQRQVAEWDGVAPANPATCGKGGLRPQLCAAYHVTDRSYLDKIIFSHTPLKDCGGDNGDDCSDYAAWNRAWQVASGAPN